MRRKEWLVADVHSVTVGAIAYHEFTVVTQRDVGVRGHIPQISARGLIHIIVGDVRATEAAVRPFIVIAPATTAVIARNSFLHIIRGVGRGGPIMSVGTHFRVREESIEYSKPLGQGMMIGRNRSRKEYECRIAVTAW